MLPGNYEQVIEMISRSSGLSKEDIIRKIELRRAKLSGLISKEGAAQIVASELGINFDKQKMKVSELLTGMRKINLLGKVVRINKVVEYNKNGRQGKIGSFLLADETGSLRIVLWDTNHIELIERSMIKEGDVVEIGGGDVRNGEMHVGSFGDIKKSKEVLNNVQEKPIVRKKKIEEITFNDNVELRAFVVQIFGPNVFEVCPECNKKIDNHKCAEHGAVVGLKKAILNLILDDGTGTIRSTLFHEQAKKIASEEELLSTENFMKKRESMIGKEFVVNAGARRNKMNESLEIVINDIKEADIDELIQELESQSKL